MLLGPRKKKTVTQFFSLIIIYVYLLSLIVDMESCLITEDMM